MIFRRLFMVLFSLALAGCLGVLATSRLYWGHWLGPPSADATAAQMATLNQFTRFYWYVDPPLCGADALVKSARTANNISGESPHGRLAASIARRGLLPGSGECLPESLVQDVTEVLRQNGRLLQTTGIGGGYYGDIAVGVSPDGGRVILAALTGSEISNDHHPYYEAVLARTPTGELKLVQARVYFYDVAGLEGAAHWVVGVLSAMAMIAVWVLVGVWVLAKRFAIFVRRRFA